jgi:hypothetical protein
MRSKISLRFFIFLSNALLVFGKKLCNLLLRSSRHIQSFLISRWLTASGRDFFLGAV